MENLTQSQNEIIAKLTKEFAKINEQSVGSADNVFAYLCDEVTKDEIRIKEISASNEAILDAYNLQIKTDVKKYGDMLREIGLEIMPFGNRDNYFQIIHQNGSFVKDGYRENAIKWSYGISRQFETILGKDYEKIKGFEICYKSTYYKDLTEVFNEYTFQRDLKILLTK